MFNVSIDLAARVDIFEAGSWYDEHSRVLGDRFDQEVKHTLIFLEEFPFAFPEVYRKVRKARVRRFPYSIFIMFSMSGLELLRVYIMLAIGNVY